MSLFTVSRKSSYIFKKKEHVVGESLKYDIDGIDDGKKLLSTSNYVNHDAKECFTMNLNQLYLCLP